MRRDYAMAAGAATVLAALLTLILHVTAGRDTVPAAANGTARPIVNAGRVTAPAPLARRTAGADGASPDIAIALDDRQALIADSALRNVMDFYLMDGRLEAPQALRALREHLQRVLPPTAAQEAALLAERYSAYLAEHDSLLAAQHFAGAPDAARLTVWQQQRHQLRVRLLGERVTGEWFGNEEAYLSQALAELTPGPEPTLLNDDEMRHREHMQQVLREAIAGAGRADGDRRQRD